MIENLNALRDGKTITGRGSGVGKPATTNLKPAATGDAGNKPNAPINVNEIWEKVVAEIGTRRPFIKNWIEEAHPLGANGRNFELGFPTDQQMVMENLSSRANREFLEALLKEASGRDWTLKLSLSESVISKAKKAPAIVHEAVEMFKGKIKS